MHKHWYEDRELVEAPSWLDFEEAQAWCLGWAAAVQACTDEQNATLARELGES